MPASFQRNPSSAAIPARWIALVFAVLAFLALPLSAADAVAGHPAATAEKDADAHAEHHGLPTAPPVLYHGIGGHPAVRGEDGSIKEPAKIGPFTVTNSMLIAWIVAVGVIVFAQSATRRIRTSREAANEVPSGAQNFWEFLVGGLYDFLGEILGPALIKKTFWFFATIFIFILATNWFGLLPGVGTIGFGHVDAHGFHLDRPIFRGGNADLNMTAAMALTFFAWWIVWAILENRHGKTGVAGVFTGILGILKHLFVPRGKESGFMKWFLIVIFVLIGLIEVISILFRPVSLSFRLYGNVFAGENILEAMQNLGHPLLAPLLPIPFYFLELLVGIVQALVFTLLTSVFTLLICEHEEEPGEGAKAHH